MNFNNVVNTAIKDRANLKWNERGSLVADIELGICWLHVHPRNTLYTELPVGTWQYSLQDDKVVRVWCNHG